MFRKLYRLMPAALLVLSVAGCATARPTAVAAATPTVYVAGDIERQIAAGEALRAMQHIWTLETRQSEAIDADHLARLRRQALAALRDDIELARQEERYLDAVSLVQSLAGGWRQLGGVRSKFSDRVVSPRGTAVDRRRTERQRITGRPAGGRRTATPSRRPARAARVGGADGQPAGGGGSDRRGRRAWPGSGGGRVAAASFLRGDVGRNGHRMGRPGSDHPARGELSEPGDRQRLLHRSGRGIC